MSQFNEHENKPMKKTLFLTVLSALLMGVLIIVVYRFSIPNPNMILITAMVLFTGIGGMVPGAASAVLMLIYSMFFFSTDHSFIHYTDINLQKMWIVVIGVVLNFLVVGILKRRQDQAEAQLKEQNRILEEEAKSARRLADLSESVASLLANIPALTSAKDIETGEYVACNQLFAEYAHKNSPQEVIGLTDADIFDPDTALHFLHDDQRVIATKEPYLFYEDVRDAAGRPMHFQTIKQNYTDASGRECILSLCVDVTELVDMKKETLEAKEAYEKATRSSGIYDNIAKVLSSDYSFLFYVDLDTEEYIQYSSDPSRDLLAVEMKGEEFFATSRRNAKTLIYPEDQERFLAVFTKEKILHDLKTEGKFSVLYRLITDHGPEHMRMRVKWLDGRENKIIIGVQNNEQEMRQQAEDELIRKERLAYSRLTALSGDYLVLFTVDPKTGSYREYSTAAVYRDLGYEDHGDNFFTQGRMNAASAIFEEDRDRFLTHFTKENVLNGIREHGIYSIKYRLMIDGVPNWANLRAALVEENGEKKLIVGVTNIDVQIRREQEYEQAIEETRALALKDALTGVRNRLSYRETEREIDAAIEAGTVKDFVLVLMDVNDLKVINDREGHQSGDSYLRAACRIICNVFKHSPVYRIGGDEFAVISEGEDAQNIKGLIGKLEGMNRTNMGTGAPVIAVGYVRYSGEKRMAEVFEKADALMYEDKQRLKQENPASPEVHREFHELEENKKAEDANHREKESRKTESES